MFLFCKPIFFSGICRIFRDLAFGSVKTRFKTFWYIFSKSWPRAPRPQVTATCCLYDIGTKILYFQCFVTTDMFLFCKPIILSGNCRIFRDLAFGSVKTRFKAILKKTVFSAQIDFSAQIYFLNELLPPEGDISAQIYFFNELLPPEGDFSAQTLLF